MSQPETKDSSEQDAATDSLPTAVMSLRIMETLANAESDLGVTELARLLGMAKARVHRHLTALREHGYVAQNARTSRYGIGWRLFLLGQQIVRRHDVVPIAKPFMLDLRDQVQQTVVITTYSETEAIVLDFVPGLSALDIGLRPGTRFDLNTVAQGKVILAFGPKALMEKTLERPLPARTGHTIVDPDRLRAEIELVRRRGWADAPEEVFTGINAIAAPVFQADGSLFGAIAVVGSIHFLPNPPGERAIKALLETSTKLSAALGHGAAPR